MKMPGMHWRVIFLFIVSISCKTKETGKTILCIGSIMIYHQCWYGHSYSVQCGSYHIRHDLVIGGRIVVAKSTFVHPYFDSSTNKYDIRSSNDWNISYNWSIVNQLPILQFVEGEIFRIPSDAEKLCAVTFTVTSKVFFYAGYRITTHR